MGKVFSRVRRFVGDRAFWATLFLSLAFFFFSILLAVAGTRRGWPFWAGVALGAIFAFFCGTAISSLPLLFGKGFSPGSLTGGTAEEEVERGSEERETEEREVGKEAVV